MLHFFFLTRIFHIYSEILKECAIKASRFDGRLKLFKGSLHPDPQKHILAFDLIYCCTAYDLFAGITYTLAIDGISYKKLYGEKYFVQEIFDSEELIANLDRNAIPVEHSIYDYIVYDSMTVEKPFALALDDDPDVKMFFKLPNQFKIDTPIGSYNPDWAVYVEIDGLKKLYFVLETKGSTSLFDLRGNESMKIQCGKEHFRAIGTGAELFGPVKDWKDFKVQHV